MLAKYETFSNGKSMPHVYESRFLEGPDPECLQEDMEILRDMLDQLEECYDHAVADRRDRVMAGSQPLFGPSYHVALDQALPALGYEVHVTFWANKKLPTPSLRSTTWASAHHARAINKIHVLTHPHPLSRMLGKATFGDFVNFTATDEGSFESKDFPLTDELKPFLPRAFMLTEQIRRIRGYPRYRRDTVNYEVLHAAGVRALGFEEIHGLAHTVIRDTVMAHEEIHPDNLAI